MVLKKKVLDRQIFPANKIILEEGQEGSCAYLIESGQVEVFLKDSKGEEITLAILNKGSIIGEISPISNRPRSASVRALEKTVLITISSHDLHKAMDKSESMYKKLTNIALGRTKDTQDKLLSKDLSEIEETTKKALSKVSTFIPADKKVAFEKETASIFETIKNISDKLS